MKKVILTSMGVIAMALTVCVESKKEADWVVDKFDDIKVMRYEVPEFENLAARLHSPDPQILPAAF